MTKIFGILGVVGCFMLPQSAWSNDSAKKIPDQFILPDMFTSCESPQTSQKCTEAGWDFAEVVKDGLLSQAEIARLIRTINASAMNAITVEAKLSTHEEATPLMQMKEIYSLNVPTASAMQIMAEYDYDGDGKISPQEFKGEFDARQPPVMPQIITMVRRFHDVLVALDRVSTTYYNNTKSVEPGAGLAHKNVKPRREVRDGVDYLVVSGDVENISDHALEVPLVKADLTSVDGKVVATTTARAAKAKLAPGEMAHFDVEFKDPPANSRNMSLGFATEPALN